MKRTSLVVSLVALAAFAGSAALAHHSAIMFDFTRTAKVQGQVKSFDLINPHMRLILRVTDAKGARDIDFEGHSRNNMFRAGWRPDMVKAGDRITVNIAPMKDGSDGGFVTSVVTADGRTFGMQSSRLQTPAPKPN